MFVIGGWNGHETMDDIYQYSFPSQLWFEIRRLKGVRPKPRYRHSAVAMKNTIFIFGGVDTVPQRFNDLFSYEVETRKWTQIEVKGQIPQERTFHKAAIFDNIMIIIGGFDGTRLNDMYHIALPGNLDTEELTQSVHKFRPSSSQGSQNAPSNISYTSESVLNQRWDDVAYLRKRVTML